MEIPTSRKTSQFGASSRGLCEFLARGGQRLEWGLRIHRMGLKMPLSGEAIRLMNYIDDVSTTLRRMLAFIPTLTVEERARVFEHLKASKPNADDVAEALKAE